MDNVETIENNEQDENPIKDLIKASLDKDYNHANKKSCEPVHSHSGPRII